MTSPPPPVERHRDSPGTPGGPVEVGGGGEGGTRGPGPSWRGWLASVALLVVLTGAALAFRGRLGAVGGAGGLPSPAVCAAVVLANLAGNALLADAWRVLVRATGPALSFGDAARVWTVSQLARYTVGAAQVPGRALAGRALGVPAAAGALTTLAEIAWGTSVVGVVVLVTAPAWLPASGDLDGVALAAAVPAAVLVAALVAPEASLRRLARLLGSGPLRRLGGSRLAEGLGRVRIGPRLAAGITARYTLAVALRVVASLALYAAVGGDVRRDGTAVAGAWALGQVLGQAAIVAPGGLGVRESATALVLAPLVGLDAGLLLAALVRAAELAAELAAFTASQALRPRGTRGARPPPPPRSGAPPPRDPGPRRAVGGRSPRSTGGPSGPS